MKRVIPKSDECKHDWCGKVATCEPCTGAMMIAIEDARKIIQQLLKKRRKQDKHIQELKTPRAAAKVFVAIEIDNGQLLDNINLIIDDVKEMSEQYPFMDRLKQMEETLLQIREAVNVITE